MPTFHPAAALTPARLGPKTPLGLFRTINLPIASLLWVVEHETGKRAIILRSDRPQCIFEAITLGDDTQWVGFSLGPVEVLVNPERAQFDDQPRFGKGAITITGGKVYVSAMPEGHMGSRITFAVADAQPFVGTAAVVFGYWQLVQRDHAGAPVVLYELD